MTGAKHRRSGGWGELAMPIHGLRLLGVPVTVSAWWIVMFTALGAVMWPHAVNSMPFRPLAAIAVAGFFPTMLFVSILIHELAHAAMGQRVGMPPTKISITLMGGHTSFDRRPPSPVALALTSAVGPISNAVLAACAAAATMLTESQLTDQLLIQAALTNAMVAVLNALPGAPLDGGLVLAAAVWGITKDYYRGIQLAGLGGLITGALVGLAALLVVTNALDVPLPSATAAWALFICVLVSTSAYSSFRAGSAGRVFDQASAASLMVPAVAMPPSAPVSAAAEWLGRGKEVLVINDGLIVGWVPAEAVEACPPVTRLRTELAQVAVSVPPHQALLQSLHGIEVADRIREVGGRSWGVSNELGQIVGVIHTSQDAGQSAESDAHNPTRVSDPTQRRAPQQLTVAPVATDQQAAEPSDSRRLAALGFTSNQGDAELVDPEHVAGDAAAGDTEPTTAEQSAAADTVPIKGQAARRGPQHAAHQPTASGQQPQETPKPASED